MIDHSDKQFTLDNPASTPQTATSSPAFQAQGTTASKAIVEAFFRHQRPMALTAATILGITLLYIAFMPRSYQSEMNILVRNARPDYLLSPEKNNGSTPLPEVTEEKINSEVEVLRSKDVADVVVDADWASKPLTDRTQAEIKSHEKSVLYFKKHLNVLPLRKSNVIQVTFTGSSPRQATETVEHLLSAFLAKQHEIERSTGATAFFDAEARRYKTQLDDAQQLLAGYQQNNQLVSLPEKEKTLEQEITGLEEAIRTTQVAINEAGNRVASGNGQLKAMPSRLSTAERSIPNTYSVEQLTTLLANLQNQRTALLVKFLPTDRLVQEVDKQIADTNAALVAANNAKGIENTTDVNPIYQQVTSSVTLASTDVRALRGRLADQDAQLDRLKTNLQNIEGSTVDYSTLQTRVTELEGNYQLYSQKRNEAEMADAMDQQNLVNVAVAERPTYTAKPYRPEPLLDLGLGIFTAIFLAGCVAFFLEMGRDTIHAPYELEALTRIPVLATVPWVTRAGFSFIASPAASGSTRRSDPFYDNRPTPRPDSGGFRAPTSSTPSFGDFDPATIQYTSPTEIYRPVRRAQPVVADQPVIVARPEIIAQPSVIDQPVIAVEAIVAPAAPQPAVSEPVVLQPAVSQPIVSHHVVPQPLQASIAAISDSERPTKQSSVRKWMEAAAELMADEAAPKPVTKPIPARVQELIRQAEERKARSASHAIARVAPVELPVTPAPLPAGAVPTPAPHANEPQVKEHEVLELLNLNAKPLTSIVPAAAPIVVAPIAAAPAQPVAATAGPLLREPAAYPIYPARIPAAIKRSLVVDEVVEAIAAPAKPAQATLDQPAVQAEPLVALAEPGTIPVLRHATPPPDTIAETEPRHRMNRLAAVRDEILGNRARLSPSQRALRTRPATTRDRYGRLAYVTYTTDANHDINDQK